MTEFEQDMGPYIPDIAPEETPQDTAPWETPDQDTPFQVPDQDPNLLREDELLRAGHGGHGDGLPDDLFDTPEAHLGVSPQDTSDIPDIPGWHPGDDQPDADSGDNPNAIN